MTTEEKDDKLKNKVVLKSVFLLGNVIIILFLLYLFYQFGPSILIIVLILLFALLTIIGPFLRKKKKRYYSRMFPDKIKAREAQRRQRDFFRRRTEPIPKPPKDLTRINLNVKYKKPLKKLFFKCSDCGMLLVSFVKKCPRCGKLIEQ